MDLCKFDHSAWSVLEATLADWGRGWNLPFIDHVYWSPTLCQAFNPQIIICFPLFKGEKNRSSEWLTEVTQQVADKRRPQDHLTPVDFLLFFVLFCIRIFVPPSVFSLHFWVKTLLNDIYTWFPWHAQRNSWRNIIIQKKVVHPFLLIILLVATKEKYSLYKHIFLPMVKLQQQMLT